MNTLKFWALILCNLIGYNLSAQQEDKELINQTIETYFDGWMTGDTVKVGSVMHSSCHLKTMRDNQLAVIERNSYLSKFKLHPKTENTYGRIISVDITGNIASAKCEIDIPERIFTDYFNMMKIGEKWFIMDKISTSVYKVK